VQRFCWLAWLACLSGCGEDPARKAVAASLSDPGSARFQSVREKQDHVCGEVNGRSEPGGQTGYRRFVYDRSSGAVSVEAAAPTSAPSSPPTGCDKPFAYQSVEERLACAAAPEARAEAERAREFARVWQKECA
jgi:hypothetical protein